MNIELHHRISYHIKDNIILSYILWMVQIFPASGRKLVSLKSFDKLIFVSTSILNSVKTTFHPIKTISKQQIKTTSLNRKYESEINLELLFLQIFKTDMTSNDWMLSV